MTKEGGLGRNRCINKHRQDTYWEKIMLKKGSAFRIWRNKRISQNKCYWGDGIEMASQDIKDNYSKKKSDDGD